jgi:D-lactate dehydrogenase
LDRSLLTCHFPNNMAPLSVHMTKCNPHMQSALRAAFNSPTSTSSGLELHLLPERLNKETTASGLFDGVEFLATTAVDRPDAAVIQYLATHGCKALVSSSATCQHMDEAAASAAGIFTAAAGAYHPHSVAEQALALTLDLLRDTPGYYARGQTHNFKLYSPTRTLQGRTVAIIGLGNVGLAMAHILQGFDCSLRCLDLPEVTRALEGDHHFANAAFFGPDELYACVSEADVIFVAVPDFPSTHGMFNAAAFAAMKPGSLFVNTARGGLVDDAALLEALQSGHLSGVGLDVYSREAEIFSRDDSVGQQLPDPVFAQLLAHPRCLVTPHAAWFSEEALAGIAQRVVAMAHEYQATASAQVK